MLVRVQILHNGVLIEVSNSALPASRMQSKGVLLCYSTRILLYFKQECYSVE